MAGKLENKIEVYINQGSLPLQVWDKSQFLDRVGLR